MRRTLISLLFMVAVISVSFRSHGFDIEAGKEKAVLCAGCHGIKGITKIATPLQNNLSECSTNDP